MPIKAIEDGSAYGIGGPNESPIEDVFESWSWPPPPKLILHNPVSGCKNRK